MAPSPIPGLGALEYAPGLAAEDGPGLAVPDRSQAGVAPEPGRSGRLRPSMPRWIPTVRNRSTQLRRCQSCGDTKRNGEKHARVRAVQALADDSRHTPHHIQALRRKHQDALSGRQGLRSLDGRAAVRCASAVMACVVMRGTHMQVRAPRPRCDGTDGARRFGCSRTALSTRASTSRCPRPRQADARHCAGVPPARRLGTESLGQIENESAHAAAGRFRESSPGVLGHDTHDLSDGVNDVRSQMRQCAEMFRRDFRPSRS
ncbi:unnamed protein product [Mycena citricolor]|uniref:Uncharacterized protein n=1 Tax=Mycena citricolor TaxID=2018698 RepID=A0AAD2K1D9_9AGAR|nr:unnamed protein product [Mycena citricolor]